MNNWISDKLKVNERRSSLEGCKPPRGTLLRGSSFFMLKYAREVVVVASSAVYSPGKGEHI